ncbi:DUF2732 family protein [Mixta gaviniae]|uniref:DUF2732 domain-containing protein n=1 Tax=Mixta gaviniae TaxID=665914 RepID=A0A1X1EFY6_9GAMM|nr:DUF2732 family protein [Mixta gaviniae]AUX94797.1 hypothetical protein C2E15_18100 [Mixta gaviniae]ORM87684.1 hypothetical protein HA44_00785 [Mixta gaviniae]
MNNFFGEKKTEDYEQPLNVMLQDARMEERGARAEVMVSRLIVLAWKIRSSQLSHVEAAELLTQEAEKFQNQAEQLH